MKRFTSFLFALLAVVCSFSAAADNVNFQVNVPDPAAVKCTVSGVERELTQGLNDFSIPQYNSVVFESVAPYMLTKVTNKAGTPQNVYSGQWSLYVYPDSEGEVYTLETINLDESRDSQCTITVDDPSRVQASLSGYNQAVNLVAGTNIVKFNSETENVLTVYDAVYDKPIYEIKLGDEVLPRNYYGSWKIDLTNNCELTINALVPDKDITVTFKYSEQGEGAIKSAKVEGEEVADFDGKTLAMKAGQTLELVPNTDFKFESFKVNGVLEEYYNGTYNYSATMMQDTEFEINAHPYGKIHYTVDVDDPDNIIFYRGYSYKNDIVTLTAGVNQLEISEGDPYVCWAAADGCFIESALVNGEPLPYGNGCDMTEGTVVKFTTGKIVYDKTAVLWLDNTDVTTYYSLRCGDENVTAVSGYNVIPYWTQMTPFQLSFTVRDDVTLVNKVYLDGTLLTPSYSTTTYASYQIDVEDKNVIKAFIATEPVNCNVTFNAPEGLEATVTYDRVKTLDKLADGLACFKGTEVAIEGADDLTVKVGETELEKNNDGKFVFTVADPATTVTLADKSSGVENVIMTTEADANAAVYNLMGVRVGTRAQLSTLPAGIYVLDGQKVIVK